MKGLEEENLFLLPLCSSGRPELTHLYHGVTYEHEGLGGGFPFQYILSFSTRASCSMSLKVVVLVVDLVTFCKNLKKEVKVNIDGAYTTL